MYVVPPNETRRPSCPGILIELFPAMEWVLNATGPIGYLWIIICFFRTLLKAMAKRLGAQRMLIFWTSLSLRVLPVGSLEPGGRCSIEQTILLHTDLLIIKNDEITLSPPLKQQTITIMSDSDRQLVIAYFLNSGCQWNWKYPASSAGGIMTYLQ